MWREVETVEKGKWRFWKAPQGERRVIKELKPGDHVEEGERGCGVSVNILDDNKADVTAIQGGLIVGLGNVDPRTLDRKDYIMPHSAKRTIEKQSIHITGAFVRRPRTVEWYPGK